MSLRRYDPFFSGFDDMFFTPGPLARDPMPLFDERLFRTPETILTRSSPGFEVNENDKNFEISMDLPGVRAEDTNVELLNDGRVLHIHGGRKVKKDDSFMETKFEKSFTIGQNVDTTKLTANLSDGVLMVTAPKKEKKEPVSQKIAISQNPMPRIEAGKDDAMTE